MFFMIIIIKLISTIGLIQAASTSFDPVGVKGLNPENDPIYNPQTGKWILDSSKDPVFEPNQNQLLSELEHISPTQNSPLSIDISRESLDSPIIFNNGSPLSSCYSPLALSEASIRSPKKHDYDPSLYVPEKCRKYDRLWDFYIGYIENQNQAIGWISQLGYTKDVIRDLKLPKTNSVYTLVPSIYTSHEKLLALLPSTHYLQITCDIQYAFNNLFTLSVNLEKRIKKGTIVAVNLILFHDCAIIKIFVNRAKETSKFSICRDYLIPLFPSISNYIPYMHGSS